MFVVVLTPLPPLHFPQFLQSLPSDSLAHASADEISTIDKLADRVVGSLGALCASDDSHLFVEEVSELLRRYVTGLPHICQATPAAPGQ